MLLPIVPIAEPFITLRSPIPGDIEPCSRILFEAFHGIATRHNFPPDLPAPEAALGFCAMLLNSPTIFGVVAEQGGVVVGSNFLWEGDAIRGVGPISVDPSVQGSGIGRRLMQAVIERGRKERGIRLVQDSFNLCSLPLYTSLGFAIKEPLAVVQGRPQSSFPPHAGRNVRPFAPSDLDDCAALCRRVHGFDRASELRNGGPLVQPWVLEREGRITGYVTTLHFWPMAHGVAETEDDLQALILGVAAQRPEPISFLVPTREGRLFSWCLAEGLRVVKPMNLMAMGAYHEPQGAWFPSVIY